MEWQLRLVVCIAVSYLTRSFDERFGVSASIEAFLQTTEIPALTLFRGAGASRATGRR
jgi:hypothetical protein